MKFKLQKQHFKKDQTAKLGPRFVSNGQWAAFNTAVLNQEVVASADALRAFLGPQIPVDELSKTNEDRLAQFFKSADLTARATGWIKVGKYADSPDMVQYIVEREGKPKLELFLDRVYTEMFGVTKHSVKWSGKGTSAAVIEDQAVIMPIL